MAHMNRRGLFAAMFGTAVVPAAVPTETLHVRLTCDTSDIAAEYARLIVESQRVLDAVLAEVAARPSKGGGHPKLL